MYWGGARAISTILQVHYSVKGVFTKIPDFPKSFEFQAVCRNCSYTRQPQRFFHSKRNVLCCIL